MIFEMNEAGREESRAQLERLRRCRELLDLRRDRAIARAWGRGVTLDELGRLTGATSEEMRWRLEYAQDDTRNWVDGRLGGSPLELALMYRTGEITREQLIEELATFPYAPDAPVDLSLDDSPPDIVPGSWDQLASLARRGVIDMAAYGDIRERMGKPR